MKRWLTLAFMLGFLQVAFSQTAQLQIIHNSPEPTVDIWVNNQPFLTEFTFREATEFLDVPAGVMLDIGVAPSPSSSPNDIIANFEVTLEEGESYVAIASGVVGDPITPFTLLLQDDMRTTATDMGNVDLRVVHGSPDAPAVDVDARDVAQLVSNAAYGDITNYISVPADRYLLDIRVAGTDPIVATFEADLSGLAGGAGVVFASGFLGSDPGFGLFAALPNGVVVELPAIQAAKLQVIHNSPDPTVDIWVNNQPFLADFSFREATEFLEVPAGVTLDIGVAPSPSSSPNDIIANFELTLENGQNYVAIASGVVGNTDTPFTLLLQDDMRLSATDNNNVDLRVVHGSPDAPAVDVEARDVAQIVSNAAYGDITDYISVPGDRYLLDIRAAGTDPIVATFEADLSALGGGAGVVFASGFLGDDPGFGLFAALPNGMVIELPAIQAAKLQIIHNSPEPTVDIWVNNQPFLTDFAFREATEFLEVPAGVTLDIGVAPSPSSSPSDIIANFDITLENGQNYLAVASGVVGNADTPFTLLLQDNMRLTSNDPQQVDLRVVHGSPDAPAVDIFARALTQLFDNVAYGDITDYLSTPGANYILDIQPEGVDSVIASYVANLSGLNGQAATIFASGFLNVDPGFGLFVALTNGEVIELPLLPPSAFLQIIHNSPEPTVDIWVNEQPFLTDFDFRDATPFVDVPAGVDLDIGIAPSPSTSPDDIIATFTVNLEPDEYYVAIASGVVGNMDTPFTLLLQDEIRPVPSDLNNVDFRVVHGSPDAPAIDVFARDVAQIVDNASYGDITDYISVPADQYFLDLKIAGEDPILSTFDANLTGLAGTTAIVFASGILSDGDFGIYAVFPNGTVVELPATEVAKLQLIHNSPAPTVDIWVNEQPFLTDFTFREATEFTYVPAGTTLDVGVAPSPSASPDDIIANFDVTLENGRKYIAIANGIVGNMNTPFEIVIIEDALEVSGTDEVAVSVFHGSPNAPAVDVLANGSFPPFIDDLEYGQATPYILLPEALYPLDLTPANDNDNILFSYTADLNGLGGGAGMIFASGLVAGDPAFGLFAALSNGTVVELPITTSVQNIEAVEGLQVFPNPTSNKVNLRFDLTNTRELSIEMVNMLGEVVWKNGLNEYPGGGHQESFFFGDLPDGTYLLQVRTEDAISSKKIMIKN